MRFRGKKNADFGDTTTSGRAMLSFVLEHGDIVVMHGTKIHKYYEVRLNLLLVNVANFLTDLRFSTLSLHRGSVDTP